MYVIFVTSLGTAISFDQMYEKIVLICIFVTSLADVISFLRVCMKTLVNAHTFRAFPFPLSGFLVQRRYALSHLYVRMTDTALSHFILNSAVSRLIPVSLMVLASHSECFVSPLRRPGCVEISSNLIICKYR